MVNVLSPLDKVRVLTNIFTCDSAYLNACHVNARSLRPKSHEFDEMFSQTNLHAILVSETWLNAYTSSRFVSINGYTLYRNDRVNRVGGGVAIFVKNSLKSRLIESSSNSVLEYLAVEVSSGFDKCLLCVVYCPPGLFSLDNASSFEEFLECCSQNYKDIIIAGDFNVNILQKSYLSDNFIHLCQRYNLSVVNNNPTYFNTSNPSLLDLFLTTDLSAIISFNQIYPPSFLDHDILFIKYKFHILSNFNNKSYTYRDFSKIDLPALFNECENIEWNRLYQMADVDDQVSFLNSQLHFLFDKYVPLKRKTISCKIYPWFSHEIKVLISEREFLFRKYKKLRTQELHFAYKKVRNKINLLVRQAKFSYYSSKLDPKLSPRVLWSNLRKIGVCSKGETNCDLDPDSLNNYFLLSQHNISTTPHFPLQSTDGKFSFRAVDRLEVAHAVFSIKSSAVGIDIIFPRFIKIILPFLLPFVTYIFNTCITYSKFPSLWKSALVVPIPKKSNSISACDFRPISILCFLSKVLEKLLHNQIVKYLDEFKLFSMWQSGFRRFHSCETTLLKVTSDLRYYSDSGKVALLCLLDFSKAFDSVQHTYLLDKLSNLFKFSSSAILFIQNFLTDRKQRVKLKEKISSVLPITCGVPQGSIFGPLFFSLFINDLPNCVLHSRVHLYADDVQLYLSDDSGNIQQCVHNLNVDLANIWSWSNSNGLFLNPSKTHCMIINNSNLSCSTPSVILNNNPIAYVNKVKNLGVYLNNCLSCCDHVHNILNKIYSGLRSLKLTSALLSHDMRLKLVRTLIIPHFTYGCSVYPRFDFHCQMKLNIAFNDCIRYIYHLPRWAHVSSYEDSILGCSLTLFLKYKSLLLFHKLIYMKSPEYIASYMVPLKSSRYLRFNIPKFRRTVGERSYFVQVCRLWNSLPSALLRIGSLTAFKRELWSYRHNL